MKNQKGQVGIEYIIVVASLVTFCVTIFQPQLLNISTNIMKAPTEMVSKLNDKLK